MSHFTRVTARAPDVLYRGARRRNGTTRVMRDGLDFQCLSVRGNLFACHYEWGDAASASHQLGLNILMDQFGPDLAIELYRPFTLAFIALLPNEWFEFTGDDVEQAVNRIRSTQMVESFKQQASSERASRVFMIAGLLAFAGLTFEGLHLGATIFGPPGLAPHFADAAIVTSSLAIVIVVATALRRRRAAR